MKFSESHEWIKLEGEKGIVGVTDHAQKELGDIVYVELPEVGKSIKVGDEVAVLESTKAAADIYSPVSGMISEVNEELQENSELINKSPHDKGWIYKIKLADKDELHKLMDKRAYEQLVQG